MITGLLGDCTRRGVSLAALAPATCDTVAASGVFDSDAVDVEPGTLRMVPGLTLVGSVMPLTCCSWASEILFARAIAYRLSPDLTVC